MARAATSPARPRSSRLAGARPDRLLIGSVVFLVCFGLVMVYSASSATAVLEGGDPLAVLKRQVLYAGLGLVAFRLLSRATPAQLRRIGPVAVGIAGVLLVAVLMPGFGVVVNGARRWLAIGPIQVQPSEIAKLALALWIAQAIARSPRRLTERGGLIPFAGLTALLAALVLIEPDLGTAVTMCVMAGAMLLVAGAPVRRLALIAGGALLLAGFAVAASPYQRERVHTFLDPWSKATGAGFQTVQAEIAIGSGGPVGRGLGNGIQKNNYLPEAATDMIAANIGEELGLVGLLALMAGYATFGVAGYRIALRARDIHQRTLAAGITTLIVVQAAVNLGTVLGVVPVTGVPLPFVSAGGSNLVVFLSAVGILVNIGRRGRASRPSALRDASADRGRGDGRPRDARAGGGKRAAGARG